MAAGDSYAGIAVPEGDPEQLRGLGRSYAGLAGAVESELAATLGDLRAHWRVTSEWLQAATSQTHVIEVLDTEAGLWTVHPLGDRVRVEPSTPGAVWRALNALTPRRGDRHADQAPGAA